MISVLIVNFQSAQLTKRAVESVLNEKVDTEVFVVDNTATPEERECLRSVLPSRAHILFNERNEGFARACNKAFSLSKGEWIFLLNPDAYVIPPCLGTLTRFLAAMPAAAAAAPLVFWDHAMTYFFPQATIPSPIHDILTKLSYVLPAVGSLYSLSIRKTNLSLWKASLPVKVESLSGGTVMLRRSALEDVGGLFDERFFLFYEDTDLFLRLKKGGYSSYIVPAAKAVHAHRHTVTKLDLMANTRVLFYDKHYRRSPLYRIAALLPDRAPRFTAIDYGDWNDIPVFSVPTKLAPSYLFELSPYPLFIPSVGYFGSGKTFTLSEELWNALDRGEYFSRFTTPQKWHLTNTMFRWRKTTAPLCNQSLPQSNK